MIVLALAHPVWVGAHLAPAIMSPDFNGYVVQARLIAEAGRTSFSTESPVHYVGMHWLETTDGVFHSRYPAGPPSIFAATWKTRRAPGARVVKSIARERDADAGVFPSAAFHVRTDGTAGGGGGSWAAGCAAWGSTTTRSVGADR